MNWTFSESFAGIGAWGKAIERVTKRHNDTCELKWYAEIDKYASNAFAAIHDESEDKNIWDITKDIQVDPVDVFFYSPPCQTFSIAGKREGTNVDKGNLFYNALDKLKKANPKYAIMENVKGLVTGDTKDDFNNMVAALREAGYFSYWKVLNSKDYGIPQNRERVFIVSIRKDLYDQGKRFEFPKKIKLQTKLFDILQNKVDEKYLLSKKTIQTLIRHDNDIIENKTPDVSGTIHKNYYKMGGRDQQYIKINSATKDGYEVAEAGDSITLDQPTNKTRRGRVGDKVSQTLTTSCNVGAYNGYTIRKLTPLECFRLQGFDDEDYYKAVKGYDETFGKSSDGSTRSDSQMYMRAGNSITVNVIEEILENLLYDRKQAGNQLSMF